MGQFESGEKEVAVRSSGGGGEGGGGAVSFGPNGSVTSTSEHKECDGKKGALCLLSVELQAKSWSVLHPSPSLILRFQEWSFEEPELLESVDPPKKLKTEKRGCGSQP